MRKTLRAIVMITPAIAIFYTLALTINSSAYAADEAAIVAEGKKIAFSRKKGNCLACHAIAGGELPGNIGPELIEMKARFPDRAVLKSQISDSRINNPSTIMPPFGAHEILTADELDKVVSFIHTL